ncbi:MAG: Ig-like domain-containing protein, partial [Acidimicrobiales bacterium]
MRKKIIIIAIFVLLLPASIASGAIGSVQHSYEFDSSDGKDVKIVHVSGDIYVIAYKGTGNHGILKTVNINSTGTITAPSSVTNDSYEFDGTKGEQPDIIQVDSDTYAIAYRDTAKDGILKTVTIGSDGEITQSNNSTTFESLKAKNPDIIQIDSDTFAIAYEEEGSKDGWIKILNIASNGAITSFSANTGNGYASSYEFDSSDGKEPKIVHISGDIYVIAYKGTGNHGILKTVEIDGSDGIKALSGVNDSQEFDGTKGEKSDIIQVDSDTYAIAYRDNAKDGILKTVTIGSDGDIGTSFTSDTFETGQANEIDIINVSDDHYAIAYKDAGNLGRVVTVDISDTGVISNITSPVSFDGTTGKKPSIVAIDSGRLYAIAYEGPDFDGYVASIPIDVTAPTAAITYSTSGPYKSGTSVTITATFNEAVQDSPVPKIAITGANTVSATNMAKTSATVYTYSHTVGSGDGNAAVVMSIAVDVAGNAVTATPTSGSPFVVDNTAPSIGSLSLSSQPDATPDLTFTAEASSSVAITSSGTSGTVGSVGSATGSAQTITLSTLDAGTQTLTATATDAAGNTATDTISVTVDVTAPTAAITYSTSGPYKSGTSVTITATFNEAVQDSPVPKIA